MTGRRLGLATLIALLVAPAAAHAASFTQEGLPNPTGNDSYGVVAQDFNRDGFPDVAVVNGTSQRSVGLSSPADRRLRAGGRLADPTRRWVELRRLRRLRQQRRIPDVAVSNFTRHSTSRILLRQPGGGFTYGTPVQINGAGGSVTALTSMATDSLDLASAVYQGSSGNQVAVEFGQGNGTFSASNCPGRREPASASSLGTSTVTGCPTSLSRTSARTPSRSSYRGATAFATEATIPVGDAPSGLATGDFNRRRRRSTSP